MTSAYLHLAAEDDLNAFGRDPWWLMLIKVLVVFVFLMASVIFAIVAERKVLGWMQLRIGPNRTGPWGVLQSFADAMKMMLKEDVVVKRADKFVLVLAPVVAIIPAFMAWAVIPFGPEVSIFGHRTPLQITDLPVSLLYILAVTSVGIYGLVLAGWSSGSTYPLLGGLRSSAQMISYEIAMGLSFAGVFVFSGTMSTSGIVAAQEGTWYIALLPVSFLVYIVAMVGETNRLPFDLPEAEGELVSGYSTEYSSMKFGSFMLAEYINMYTVTAVACTLFLGGWRAPWPITYFWEGANSGWWPLLWFVIKLQAGLFFFIWLRATLPRLRYDQFMKLGWKLLIPVSLLWLVLVAVVQALKNDGTPVRDTFLIIAGALVAVVLLSFVWDLFKGADKERARSGSGSGTGGSGGSGGAGAKAVQEPGAPFDPMSGGYPVPPMPGQTLPPVPRRRPRAEREAARRAADSEAAGGDDRTGGPDGASGPEPQPAAAARQGAHQSEGS